jgi:hypothetical protein
MLNALATVTLLYAPHWMLSGSTVSLDILAKMKSPCQCWEQNFVHVRFEVFTAVTMKNGVL